MKISNLFKRNFVNVSPLIWHRCMADFLLDSIVDSYSKVSLIKYSSHRFLFALFF